MIFLFLITVGINLVILNNIIVISIDWFFIVVENLDEDFDKSSNQSYNNTSKSSIFKGKFLLSYFLSEEIY